VKRTAEERVCRPVVEDRAGPYCERCGVHAHVRGLTMHHRVKVSQGGPWTPQNVVWLCGHGTTRDGCHCWVEHHPDDAEKEGFHVRPWDDPNTTPVLYRGERSLLTDLGGVVRAEGVA
jgi:hypothetical protein